MFHALDLTQYNIRQHISNQVDVNVTINDYKYQL